MDSSAYTAPPRTSRLSTPLLSVMIGFCVHVGLCACDDTYNETQQEQSPDALPSDTQAPRWTEGASLTITRLDPRSIHVGWPPAHDDRGVETYRVSLNNEEVTRVPARASQVTLTALEPERVYAVTVSALDAAQNESAPLHAEFTLSEEILSHGWGADAALRVEVDESSMDGSEMGGSAQVVLSWPQLPLEGIGYAVSHDGVDIQGEVRSGEAGSSETGSSETGSSETGSGEMSVTLEGVERGRWHSFEVRAIDITTRGTIDSLSARLFIRMTISWPMEAALEVEQDQVMSETRLSWPSLRGAETLESQLRYRVVVGDRVPIEVAHGAGERQSLTLGPLPEGEIMRISVMVTSVMGTSVMGANIAEDVIDMIDSLTPLTTEVTGLDRSPPHWPTSTPSPSALDLSLSLSSDDPDLALYVLSLVAPQAQDRVGVSGYRATLGGEALDVTWSLESSESLESDEPQYILGVTSLTPEEVTQRYGAWVDVIAFDAVGLESAPLSAQLIPTASPSIDWPTWAQVKVRHADAESITLAWPPALTNHAELALRYQVNIDGAEVALIDAQDELGELVMRVSDLTPEREYQVEVIALNTSGARSPSLQARVSTPPYEQPRWSSGAEVIIEALDHERAVISWPEAEARAYAQRYVVRSRGETLAEVNALDVVHGRFIAEVNGLTPLTTYTFEVDAEGPHGDRALTPLLISLETLARPTMVWPEAVTLTATPLSDTTLELRWPMWSGDEALEVYVIYRDLTHYEEVSPETAGDPPSFVITDLRPRSASRWRVQARGVEGGFSHNGPEAQALQPDTAPPTWPDPSLNVIEITATTVEVSWSPAIDLDAVAEYRLLINGETRLSLSAESALNARLEGLTPGAQDLISIRAVDIAGNVSLSGPESLITLPPLVPLRTDEEVMRGLTPTCGVCHGGCPQCLDDWFSSVAQFRSEVVNDPLIVTPGDPDASLLVRLLRGTDSGLWGQMPPSYFEDGAPFIDRRARGETTLTVAEVERWIEEMATP